MNKYIAYCRKSTDEKDKQVLSIEAQIAELKEFAKLPGISSTLSYASYIPRPQDITNTIVDVIVQGAQTDELRSTISEAVSSVAPTRPLPQPTQSQIQQRQKQPPQRSQPRMSLDEMLQMQE